MSTASSEDARCKALTEDGDRCRRPAGPDGYCYQHDEGDETVEDEDVDGDATAADEDGDGAETDQEAGNGGTDRASADESQNEEAIMTQSESEIQETDIGQVRQSVQEVAAEIVGYPLDGITSIDSTDEGWRAAVEVVERKGVPDTQDILGRYEIRLDDDLEVTGYQRTHRYRRDDMDHDI